MRKISAIVVAAAFVGVQAFAQDTLFWFNSSAYVSPTNVATLIPTSVNQAIGALVQLIRDGGNGVQNGPSGFGTTGVAADDTLINTWWAGAGGESDGFFSNFAAFTNLAIGLSSSIYVRVWDRPTSGGDNIPSPFDYGGGQIGAFYFDSTVRLANADPGGGTFYNYIPNSLDAPGQWSFLAIPEPGTMALAGLGLVAMLIRARRKHS